MATKTIQTRIKNRIDTLTNWQADGVTLLPGEIALVKVTTQQIDSTTGNVVNVPAILMKVGESDGSGGTKSFNELPWLSAKASDVYSWAKTQHAKDINVDVINGTATETKSLGTWLKTVNDTAKANAANITNISSKIDVDKVSTAISTAISSAINALDSTSSGDGTFVKSVVQTDGKIAVTMGKIAEDELPDISATKITTASALGTTVEAALTTIGSKIANLESKQNGHTDAEINTLINTKVATLDSEVTGSGAIVTDVSQVDGKVFVSKGSLVESNIPELGTSKIVVTPGSGDAKITLDEKLNSIDAEFNSINAALAGGVHFIGTVTSPTLTDGANSNPVTVDGKSYAPSAGDVVIQDGKEFIWDGSVWKELGDLSRVGALETKVNNLDVNDAAVANNFVTAVSQTDGKITVHRAQPTAANISHNQSLGSTSTTTVAAALEAHNASLTDLNGKVDVTKVSVAISEAINALDANDPEAKDTSTSFISTIQQENGKITATKANLPEGNTVTKGIVKLGTTGGAATYDRVEAIASNVSTNVEPRIANIEDDYVRFTDDKLYVGKDGADIIIFDCGTAANL